MPNEKENKNTVMAKSSPPKKSALKKTAATKKAARAKPGAKAPTKQSAGVQKKAAERKRTLLLQGHEVSFTNLRKQYWPKEEFRKGDMVDYYLQMAPFILPYLLNRPHSLHRHPDGIDAPHFFQKNMRGKIPGWIETFA